MVHQLKQCTKCGETKPTSEFYKQRGKYLRPNCKSCENKRSRAYHHANRDKRVKQISEYGKRSKYGIAPDEYEKLVASHGGKCGICGMEEVIGRALAIDHDHKSGKVRGLLCSNCNNGLGRFKDDIALLAKAIKYLEDK